MSEQVGICQLLAFLHSVRGMRAQASLLGKRLIMVEDCGLAAELHLSAF